MKVNHESCKCLTNLNLINEHWIAAEFGERMIGMSPSSTM